MRNIDEFEEKCMSAYCRLSFVIWYQGYKDDISKYLDNRRVRTALECAIKDVGENNKVKVDASLCLSKYSVDEFVEELLAFLFFNEDLEVICAAEFELQKDLVSRAYSQTMIMIDNNKITEEIFASDALITLYSFKENDNNYIKILPDNEVCYAIYTEENKSFVRKTIKIESNLFNRLVSWGRSYVDKNKITEWYEGGEGRFIIGLFHLKFNCIALGFEKEYDMFPCVLFEVDGHGPVTDLLRLPELSEFVKREVAK